MSRSLKKGPFVDQKVLKKVERFLSSDKQSNKVIKTWSRSCTIIPKFIGLQFSVYNGRKHVTFRVTEEMVGYKLGEFSLTKTFRGHAAKGKIAKASGSTGSSQS